MQRPFPCLWFDRQAEEAVNFYTSLIPNSRINEVSRYQEGMPLPAGTVLTMYFELNGQPFMALNGGPEFKFTPAVSFVIYCENQDEIDRLWDGLMGGGGGPDMCGWLHDRYGVSWQIVPIVLGQLMSDPDPEKAQRVTAAMLQMQKLDIAGLERAYRGE